MFNKLSSRLVFWILTVSALFQLPLALFDYSETRRTLLRSTAERGRLLVESSISSIGGKRRSVENSAETLAAVFSEWRFDGDEAQLEQQLRAFVLSNDDIYGATIAFESGSFADDLPRYAPYFSRTERGDLIRADLADERYRY